MAKETTKTPRSATRGEGNARRAATPARRGAATAGVGERRTSIITFFQESRAELRKVTWPTRQETQNLTVAVIGMTLGIAAFLGAIDSALDYLVKPLLGAK